MTSRLTTDQAPLTIGRYTEHSLQTGSKQQPRGKTATEASSVSPVAVAYITAHGASTARLRWRMQWRLLVLQWLLLVLQRRLRLHVPSSFAAMCEQPLQLALLPNLTAQQLD